MENINRGFERKYGSILGSCDKNKKKVEECDKVQECDKKTSSKKELQESPIYGLKNEYDSKGFGGKAQVETDNKGNETLYSYDTPVVKLSGDKVTLLPKWDSSATTLRHVKEFLKQHDLKAESKEQIAKDYGAKVDEDCKKGKRQNRKMKISEGFSNNAYDVAGLILDMIPNETKVVSWEDFGKYFESACNKGRVTKAERDDPDFETDVRAILSQIGWETIFEGEKEGGIKKTFDKSTDNYTDRVKLEIHWIRSAGDTYTYRFLYRLKLDNDYFLGNGDGYTQGLFMGNVKDQISLMRGLYDALKVKPEWLTKDDIDDYEEKMVNYKKHHRNEYRIGYDPITGKKIELESCARGRRKSIRELLEEISPEDQHDSDLLRSAILKSRGRGVARFTKAEKGVMDKYDLTVANDGGIYKKGKEGKISYKLDRDVDVGINGKDFINQDKVNIADRARKLGTREYEKTVGDTKVVRDISGQYSNDSWRAAQARDMQTPYRELKYDLRDRNIARSGLAKAQAEYEASVEDAKRRFDSSSRFNRDLEKIANDRIDRRLKRGKYAPATEGFRRKRIKEARGVEIDDTFDEINAFLQGGEFEKTTRPGMKGRSRIKGIVDYRQVGVTRDGDIKVRVEDEDRAEEVEKAVLDKFGDVVEIERKKDKYDDKLPINIIIKIVGGEVIDDIDKKFKSKNESIGSDVAEYQKWVDYDMKRYKKISDKTMSKIKKAGLSVVKDQYGDYEVIAKEPVRESIANKSKKGALTHEFC